MYFKGVCYKNIFDLVSLEKLNWRFKLAFSMSDSSFQAIAIAQIKI